MVVAWSLLDALTWNAFGLMALRMRGHTAKEVELIDLPRSLLAGQLVRRLGRAGPGGAAWRKLARGARRSSAVEVGRHVLDGPPVAAALSWAIIT
ncbi:hypothetical protein FAIPA1_310041 [Frankia sp. AiPs1]